MCVHETFTRQLGRFVTPLRYRSGCAGALTLASMSTALLSSSRQRRRIKGGPTRVYRGIRQAPDGGWDESEVLVCDGDGEVLHPLRHHRRHSPDGFSWGYGGSGPMELARCILIDHFGLHSRAQRNHPSFELPVRVGDFLRDVTSQLDQKSDWQLTNVQIERWIQAQQAGAAQAA